MGSRILTESEVQSDILQLDQAWRDPDTFAFIPDKAAVSRQWLESALEQLPVSLQEDHFALLTSGSTGNPKLIIGDRKRAEQLAGVLHSVQSGEAVDQTIVSLPMTYCYAFVNQWLWARVKRRQLVLTQGFSDTDQLRDTLAGAENAMLCLVGAQVPLFRQFMGDDSFPGVVRLHFAGGRFPQEHLDFLASLFPNATVFNNYGCAEAMPRLSLRHAADSDSARNIGRPITGVELMSTEDGRLMFRSPYAAVAFVSEAGLQELDPQDWIETGDLGHQIDDQSWQLEGRSNEVFKRYGEKISLPRLLSTVNSVWGGEAAFYRDTDGSGEEACVLVLAPDPDKGQVRAILKALREDFARPHWPLRVESLAVLPKLANQKIDGGGLAAATDKKIHWRQRI